MQGGFQVHLHIRRAVGAKDELMEHSLDARQVAKRFDHVRDARDEHVLLFADARGSVGAVVPTQLLRIDAGETPNTLVVLDAPERLGLSDVHGALEVDERTALVLRDLQLCCLFLPGHLLLRHHLLVAILGRSRTTDGVRERHGAEAGVVREHRETRQIALGHTTPELVLHRRPGGDDELVGLAPEIGGATLEQAGLLDRGLDLGHDDLDLDFGFDDRLQRNDIHLAQFDLDRGEHRLERLEVQTGVTRQERLDSTQTIDAEELAVFTDQPLRVETLLNKVGSGFDDDLADFTPCGHTVLPGGDIGGIGDELTNCNNGLT